MSRFPSLQQKTETFALLNHEPTPAQLPFHAADALVLQLVGAEGAGKSHVAAAEMTACLPWCDLIYLVGQTYDNTHAEFNYMAEMLRTLGAVDESRISQPRQGSWQMVTKTGCTIVTLSVERGASSIIARGQQPDIICLTEAGVINSYSVFLAAVRRARRARGRCILIGTLKDDYGWYASLVDDLTPAGNVWHGATISLPAWTNLHLYPGGRDDPEIKYLEATMPDGEFARTIAARKVPNPATVFTEFSYSIHVRECPFDSSLPVHIWIDPGYFPSAYVVLAVQFHGPEVWLIDEIYLNHHTHREIIKLAQKREWWANVERGVIDVAGKQHHAEASATEVWKAEAGIRLHSQPVGIMDGISQHRRFLRPARLFHDPCCVGTLAEYKKYRRKADRDGNPTSDMPVDADNHAMKAIAYGLVDRFGFADGTKKMQSASVDWYAPNRPQTAAPQPGRSRAEVEEMLEQYE